MSWSDRARALAALALAARAWRLFPAALRRGRRILAWSQAMREIEVAPIPDRIGHYLGDDLDRQIERLRRRRRSRNTGSTSR